MKAQQLEVVVHGKERILKQKTWLAGINTRLYTLPCTFIKVSATSGHEDTQQHCKNRSNIYYVGKLAVDEMLFNSQNFDAMFNRHKNMLLHANSILVDPENPSVPIKVLVRLRLEWGLCKNVSGVLYDIDTKDISIDTCGKWIVNIFKVIHDSGLVPNVDLVGADIDGIIATAESKYKDFMRSGKKTIHIMYLLV